MYPDGVGRDQLSVLTGYKKSSRNAYISRLVSRGLVDANEKIIMATAAGMRALGPSFEPLPTGFALQEYWLARLPDGEKKILAILLKAYPNVVRREELDAQTGYKKSSRNAYISRLLARRLVQTYSNGAVAASDTLFDGP